MVKVIYNNETVIYVRLNGGVETFAPCQARKLENGKYEIFDNENLDLEKDATSIWEFFPGDIVTCIQKEDYKVAENLITSTFPDRKLYEFLFLLVNNFETIKQDTLIAYKNEIKRLCADVRIIQRKHPLVSKWLKINCVDHY